MLHLSYDIVMVSDLIDLGIDYDVVCDADKRELLLKPLTKDGFGTAFRVKDVNGGKI